MEELLIRAGLELALRSLDAGVAGILLLLLLRISFVRARMSSHFVHAILWVGLLHFLLPRAPGPLSFEPAAAPAAASLAGIAQLASLPIRSSLLMALAVVHALGFSAVLVAIWRQELQLRGWTRASVESPSDLEARFASVARRIGLGDTPRLILSETAPTPMATGFLSPTVLVPVATLRALTEAQMDDVLAHELGHLRRRDPWWNALRVGICALWWFHPVSWLLSRELRDAREECCDETVLATLRLDTKHYARTLLSAAEIAAAPRAQWIASGVVGGRAHPLLTRLRRLAHLAEPKLRLPAWGWLAAVVLLGSLWSTRPVEAGYQSSDSAESVVRLHLFGHTPPSASTSHQHNHSHEH